MEMTDRYAVIGNPISHSKSPLIHRMFAEQTGQDMRYEAIEAPPDGFAATVQRLRGEGYKGCNVTVPFKFEAYAICDQLGARAQDAKAVNTLLFQDGRILGTNTDGPGLLNDIEQNLGFKLMWKDALLLGAGGAAAGVLWPLFNAGAGVDIANRTLDKAQALAGEFRDAGTVYARSYADLAGRNYDLIVNATSSGLRDELPPLPDGLFRPGALAYDMMYGRETPFMAFARKQGATIVADGLGMLVEQAAEAFQLWRGVRPDTRPVLEKLRQ
jgi:shikimate dehydrogenase